MLHQTDIEKIAEELLSADRSRQLIPRLTARYEDMEIEDSYAVQSLWAQHRLQAGHRIVGHKIGLTSKAMQAATGISEPDYGVIFDDTVYENGSVIPHDTFLNVRIEVELAFILDKPLKGPDCTMFDVLEATRFVVPALEILNSHIEMADRTIVDTISDNAAYGAMVLGGRPVAVNDLDLRWVSALLYKNESIEETGVAAGVLNHPATGVAWLANKLAHHGTSLAAGEIILSGSFTRPMWVDAGDTVHADYGTLGAITCRFA